MKKNEPNEMISDIEQKLKNFVPEDVPSSLSDKLLKIGTPQPVINQKYGIHKYFWMGMAASALLSVIGIYFLLSQDINKVDTFAVNTHTNEVTTTSADLPGSMILYTYADQISSFNKKARDKWQYLSSSMDNTLTKMKPTSSQKEYFHRGSNIVLAFLSTRTPGVITAALADAASLSHQNNDTINN